MSDIETIGAGTLDYPVIATQCLGFLRWHPPNPTIPEYSSVTAMTHLSIWTGCCPFLIVCVGLESIATSISMKSHRQKGGRDGWSTRLRSLTLCSLCVPNTTNVDSEGRKN